MENVRFTQLEQRLAQVETELATSHQLIEELRLGATRSRFLGRLTSAVAACALTALLALTVGPATAAPGPRPLTVKTPFQVENQAGQVIFRIVEQSGTGSGIAKVYDADGKTLVALQANESGGSGEVAVNGATEGQIARLSTSGGAFALRFYRSAKLQTGVGEDAFGGIVQVNNRAGKVMAHVGSTGENGVVELFDTDGTPRALLSTTTETHGGVLELYGAAGGPRVSVRATGAAGALTIANAAGTARVEAGVLAGDKGVVRTYGPKGFDYISGR